MRNGAHSQRVFVTPIAIVLAALILLACSGTSAAVIPTPTSTPTSVPTSVPTATPSPTPNTSVYLHVESTPVGATVRTGIQFVNNISDVKTGRVVGVSPLTVQIYPIDVSRASGSNSTNLVTLLRFPGYYDNLVVINLGPGALEPGRTYTISAKLMPLPTTRVLPHPQGAPSVL